MRLVTMNKAEKELASIKALLPAGTVVLPLRALDALVIRPRVGVGCILFCSDLPGQVLVGERVGSHGEGRWALPGGHLEYGSTWGGCASDELHEETNLKVDPQRWHLIHTTNDVMHDSHLHYITLFLAARVTLGEVEGKVVNMEEDKCKGWKWMAWSDLAGGTVPIFLPLANFISEGGVEKLKQAASSTALKCDNNT